MTARRYTLLLLTCYFAIAHMDRHIITITLEPIRREFGLSDLQLGLLSGFAFAMFFSLLILPFAIAATRVEHRKLIAGTIGVWSAMTILTGMAQSYIHLLLARIGIGIGEAGALPASHAAITDHYPPEKRATAMGIFVSGANIGLALALVLGGFVAQKFGWRWAMITTGLPGLFLALIIRFTMPVPVKDSIVTPSPPGNRSITLQTARIMWSDISLRFLLLGTIFSAITTFGIAAWLPSFLVRTHGLSLIQVGLYLAITIGVFGMIGAQLAGRLSDHFAKRKAGWIVWVPALAILIAKPFTIVGLLSQQPLTALIFLAVPAALGGTYLASTISVLHTRVPPKNKPVASALLLLSINFIGMGFGPLIVGALSDYWRAAGYEIISNNPLAIGLSAVQIFGIMGAVFYALAGRRLNVSDES